MQRLHEESFTLLQHSVWLFGAGGYRERSAVSVRVGGEVLLRFAEFSGIGGGRGHDDRGVKRGRGLRMAEEADDAVRRSRIVNVADSIMRRPVCFR